MFMAVLSLVIASSLSAMIAWQKSHVPTKAIVDIKS